MKETSPIRFEKGNYLGVCRGHRSPPSVWIPLTITETHPEGQTYGNNIWNCTCVLCSHAGISECVCVCVCPNGIKNCITGFKTNKKWFYVVALLGTGPWASGEGVMVPSGEQSLPLWGLHMISVQHFTSVNCVITNST